MSQKLLTNKFLSNISLGLENMTEKSAIDMAGNLLWKNGYVEKEYITGMLKREEQQSTYIGYGIAIPHGTYESHCYIKKSGISILQFPKGISYGNNRVYVMIGIACREEDVIQELMQITDLLSKEPLRNQLLSTESGQVWIDMINQNYEIEGRL